MRALFPGIKACQGDRCLFVTLIIPLLLLGFPLPGTAEIAKVQGIRIADHLSYTRVVFDLSATAEHRIFVLQNPDRVVLDIEKCDANGQLTTPPIVGPLLQRLRYAQKSREKLRVVFDLNMAVRPKSFLLTPSPGKNHRLVINLMATTQENRDQPVLTVREAPMNIRDAIIAIDAGHGGKDPGAIGHGGSREKDIVLSIAKRLQKLIDKEKGMRAVLIRKRDVFMPLRDRIQKARDPKADVFISIHADAAVDRKARGSSVYVLSQHAASSEQARILAQRENAADKIGQVNLKYYKDDVKKTLIELSQNGTIKASIDLAESILSELDLIGNILRPQVEQAGFAVLKSPDIPSVLVETAFISNRQEERRLRSKRHQQKLAVAILKGVRRYLRDHAPNDVLLAHLGKGGAHTIRRGDTLSGIAHRYHVSVIDLRRLNALKSDVIRVGQVLTIPASTGT